MKKTFKKVVTAVTTAALALAGAITFNPADAFAAKVTDESKTVYLVVPQDYAAGWTMNTWGTEDSNWSTGFDTTAAATLESTWGTHPAFTKVQDNLYKLSLDVYDDGALGGIQILGVEEVGGDPVAYQAADDALAAISDAFYSTESTEVWISANDGYTVTVTDPVEIVATDADIAAIAETAIDKALAVDATLENRSAYDAASATYADLTDAQKELVDAEKVAALEKALAIIAELQAAADAQKAEANKNAAGTLTVYVKAPSDWEEVDLYSWTDTNTGVLGAWPGTAIEASEKNAGWYGASFAIDGLANIIFNNNDGLQTENIEELSAGTYWFTLVAPEEEDGLYTVEKSAEAPEGWVEEEVKEIETQDPEPEPKDPPKEPASTASGWADAALKVHVKLPELENWDALGIYLFGTGDSFGWSGGSGELTGAWPGAELLQEINSETWYAFGGTFSDGYYMAIINNLVSDDAVAEGAVKCQAADLELTDGEYWITIVANEDGTFTAEVVTEAPEDYDGEGLDDSQIAEAPATEDGNDGSDGSSDGSTNPPTDGLPIAGAMVVAMLAGAVVVTSRKRKVA